MTDDATSSRLQAGYAYLPGDSPAYWTLGDDDEEIPAPPGTYVYIPPGTRHSFSCGSTVGRVYNTLVPGGFDHGITETGTPAPQVEMPPPGTSALEVWAADRVRAPGRSLAGRPADGRVVVVSGAAIGGRATGTPRRPAPEREAVGCR